MVAPAELISRLKDERYDDWSGGYLAVGCELVDEAIAFIEEQAKLIEAAIVWQPVGTAPKKYRCDVWCENEMGDQWRETDAWMGADGVWSSNFDGFAETIDGEVTHWMIVPAPKALPSES